MTLLHYINPQYGSNTPRKSDKLYIPRGVTTQVNATPNKAGLISSSSTLAISAFRQTFTPASAPGSLASSLVDKNF